ncbi:hypothetical protein DFH01_10205 [Falsiroseomonas bella]|uniref:Uncharacterized protein n=1 Tax=Falsiroseomonas bella TaxID=2184016 RepID=A0A317FFR8_9PROT|nr:hypothetical protein [Falsiroseomonas bella]PWS37222.1 hypothetical protein DFH01_10205 [Falsiroseomonas bella]
MRRRRLLLAILLLPAGAAAQQRATRSPASDFWFDPTQLPAFTGIVERYLLNPRGETDALLFREGPQIVFPPEFGAAVRAAAPPGRPIVVWGIRARHAPVITMLAFAPDAEAAPVVVERFYWRAGRDAAEQAAPLAVQGIVKAPYFAPQGEVTGAVLEDGTVVTVPPGSVEALRDLLKAGATLAAEGRGVAGENGRALAADRIGANPEALRPIPASPAPTSRQP